MAIVAGAHGKYSAPFFDKDWECWGVNATWAAHRDPEKKFTRWFELHRRKYLEWEHQSTTGGHFAWLRSLRKLPVYVQDVAEWPDLLTAKPYPFERVAKVAPAFKDYHCCSIDWMVGLAIAEGAKEIALYGVEQLHTAEPLSSRACVEFWCGIAVGKGIKAHSTEGTTFKITTVVCENTPYALDPKWLPVQDRTSETNANAVMRQRLADTVDGTLEAKDALAALEASLGRS